MSTITLYDWFNERPDTHVCDGTSCKPRKDGDTPFGELWICQHSELGLGSSFYGYRHKKLALKAEIYRVKEKIQKLDKHLGALEK